MKIVNCLPYNPSKDEKIMAKGDFDKAIELCETNLNADVGVVHNYLNLASLIYNEQPERAISLLDKAISLNPLLMSRSIYITGERPNLFYYQSSFLSTYKNAFDIYNQLKHYKMLLF